MALCGVCARPAGRQPVHRALLLPLSLPAGRRARHSGPDAPVRMAEAAQAVRFRVPDLRQGLPRAGHSSARPDQSQRMRLLHEVPGDLLGRQHLSAAAAEEDRPRQEASAGPDRAPRAHTTVITAGRSHARACAHGLAKEKSMSTHTTKPETKDGVSRRGLLGSGVALSTLAATGTTGVAIGGIAGALAGSKPAVAAESDAVSV